MSKDVVYLKMLISFKSRMDAFRVIRTKKTAILRTKFDKGRIYIEKLKYIGLIIDIYIERC